VSSLRVCYFGPLLDVTGLSEESLAVDLPATVAAMEAQIIVAHPGLEERQYRVAVDEILRERDEMIDDAREIALLPPFSGG
jgi:molybdopterin converting factor small subunit